MKKRKEISLANPFLEFLNVHELVKMFVTCLFRNDWGAMKDHENLFAQLCCVCKKMKIAFVKVNYQCLYPLVLTQQKVRYYKTMVSPLANLRVTCSEYATSFSELQQLVISGVYSIEIPMRVLSCFNFPILKELKIVHDVVAASMLQIIAAACPQLRKLDVSLTLLKSQNTIIICNFPRLVCLKFSYLWREALSLKVYISHIPALVILKFACSNFDVMEIGFNVSSLKEIRSFGSGDGCFQKLYFKEVAHLRCLNLPYTNSKTQLDPLCKVDWNYLEDLTFALISGYVFLDLSSLKYLAIDFYHIVSPCVEIPWKTLSALEELRLVNVTDEVIFHFIMQTRMIFLNVKVLEIVWRQPAILHCSILSQFPNVEQLYLRGGECEGSEHILKLKKLGHEQELKCIFLQTRNK